LLCLLAMVPAAGPAALPAASPTVSKADEALEAQPLRVSASDTKAGDARTSATNSVSSGASDLSRIFIALLIVIGVILVLRQVVRHMTAMPGSGRAGKMVTVLSRSMISPRQQVLVLQVGNRLLVVGDSAGRMNPLCEITDPDEIAMLLGQTRQARDTNAERNPMSFLNLFRRANEPFSENDALAVSGEDPEKGIDPDEAVSSEEMSGLIDKVRMLQEQFRAKA
jgi:flagellar biogenesis protein FliO